MNKKHLSLIAASLYLSSTVIQAETNKNTSWYVVPQVGALIADDAVESKNSWFGGVKLGKPVSDNWDVQMGLSYAEAEEDSNAFSSGKYKQSLLSLEALYLFNNDDFRPFISIGLGAAQDKLSYSGTPNASVSETSLMGSLGAGFQYAWTKKTFLQADVRYVLSTPTYNNGNTVSFSGLDNIYASIGLGFHFGDVPQPTPKAAPAPVVVAPAAPKTCEELGNCKKVEAPKVEIAPVVEAKPVPPAPVKYEVVENNLRADGAFATGSGKLTKQGQAKIDAAIAAAGTSYATLTKTEGLELEVIGHADRTGKADVNQKLSEQRAEAVKAYLVSKGLNADAIKTAGRGSSQPVTKPEDCKNLKGKKLSSCLSVDRRIELHGKATRVVKAQ